MLSQVSPTSPKRPSVSHGRSTSSTVSFEATLAAYSVTGLTTLELIGARSRRGTRLPSLPPERTQPQKLFTTNFSSGTLKKHKNGPLRLKKISDDISLRKSPFSLGSKMAAKIYPKEVLLN